MKVFLMVILLQMSGKTLFTIQHEFVDAGECAAQIRKIESDIDQYNSKRPPGYVAVVSSSCTAITAKD